jgi:hypothetical protein
MEMVKMNKVQFANVSMVEDLEMMLKEMKLRYDKCHKLANYWDEEDNLMKRTYVSEAIGIDYCMDIIKNKIEVLQSLI